MKKILTILFLAIAFNLSAQDLKTYEGVYSTKTDARTQMTIRFSSENDMLMAHLSNKRGNKQTVTLKHVNKNSFVYKSKSESAKIEFFPKEKMVIVNKQKLFKSKKK